MVRSLANVVLKKVWARLLLRQRALQEEENTRKQKESGQESLMADLALSAKQQISNQVEKDLEPKLDLLLAQKVKPQAMRKKETAFKKERNVKYGHISNVARKQSKRSNLEFQDHPVENESTLVRFAKHKFGVELSIDSSDDRKPAAKPSGKVLPHLEFLPRGEVIPKSWTVTVWTLHL